MRIIITLLIYLLLFTAGRAEASEQSALESLTDKVQAPSFGLPSVPSGMYEKGFVGETLSRIFNASGKIRAEFIDALAGLYYIAGNQSNIPKWTGTGFTLGTMYDISGNVGIGTSSPTEKLDINGNMRARMKLFFGTGGQSIYGDNSSRVVIQSNTEGTSQMEFTDSNGTRYGRLYGGASGASFGLLDSDLNWSYLAVKDQYTHFRINNATIMTLSGGNVGIGTSTPLTKLDVAGKIRMQTQTSSGDTDDIVATKGYVDSKISSSHKLTHTDHKFIGGSSQIYTASFSGVNLGKPDPERTILAIVNVGGLYGWTKTGPDYLKINGVPAKIFYHPTYSGDKDPLKRSFHRFGGIRGYAETFFFFLNNENDEIANIEFHMKDNPASNISLDVFNITGMNKAPQILNIANSELGSEFDAGPLSITKTTGIFGLHTAEGTSVYGYYGEGSGIGHFIGGDNFNNGGPSAYVPQDFSEGDTVIFNVMCSDKSIPYSWAGVTNILSNRYSSPVPFSRSIGVYTAGKRDFAHDITVSNDCIYFSAGAILIPG